MSLQNIIADCGLTYTHYEPVHGGDINTSYCLYSSDARYFLKVNDANRYPSMFEKEANGLNHLAGSCTLTLPRVIRSGITGQQQWLLLEWLEHGPPKKDCWQDFGEGLANLHRHQQPWFGWEVDNYIGSLPQKNTKHDGWQIFYAECRILPLVEILVNKGVFSKQDANNAAAFCKKLEQLFPAEPPALLHGDLWSGNYMITAAGYAALFDPAIYYGHREMDMGMTRLFGGFDPLFYDAYNAVYPLAPGWQERLPFTQLYPLLVHAVLFGGHYVATSREIMSPFS